MDKNFTPTANHNAIMTAMKDFLESDLGWSYKDIMLTLIKHDSHYLIALTSSSKPHPCGDGKDYFIEFVKVNEPSFKLDKPLKVTFMELT